MTMTQPFISLSDTKTLYSSEQALPLIVVNSPKCYSVISLYGGQILEFKAKDKPNLLWLSPIAIFESGKAIRGGVPICAPWFGPHRGEEKVGITYPNHGFARTSIWQKKDVVVNQNNDIQISLLLNQSASSEEVFPHQFSMEIQFTLGDELTIEFSIVNNSSTLMNCEWALHSYFTIDNIEKTSVGGLDTYQYVDSANNKLIETLRGPLYFKGEVDRYFIDGSTTQTIKNTPPINISGNNCNSVITWNPGAQLAANMADIGEDLYQQFVCVERGAIFDNLWKIAPSQKQTATMVLSN